MYYTIRYVIRILPRRGVLYLSNERKTLTTAAGNPVGDNQNSITAGQSGPTLIQDVHLLEKLAHFNRERIPERVVHAKGAGAHGYFEVTNDVSKYTKAKFLGEVGKRTPLLARFSTVAGELGSADTVRDPRGFKRSRASLWHVGQSSCKPGDQNPSGGMGRLYPWLWR